jgi:cytochrome b
VEARTESRSSEQNVLVWDWMVRAFHWSTVILFSLAYVFDSPRALHTYLGYTLLGVLCIRVIWGFLGSRYARFSDFVVGPGSLRRYAVSVMTRREKRYLGHNPAGALMVLALMLTLAAIGVTGWMIGLDRFFGDLWVQDLHEWLVDAALIMIGLHVLGVIYTSLHHRENLVRAMITGRKRGD